MKFFKFLLLLAFLLNVSAYSQVGFQFPKHKNQVKIPFSFINNLIIFNVEINGVCMAMLLDTGVSETILFSIDDKNFNLNQVEKLNFTGLGEGTETQGLISKGNRLSAEELTDTSHTLYIILDSDFNFSSQVGIPVNGIIGYDFFANFPVKIDYQRKKIIVYSSIEKALKKNKNFTKIPLSVINHKPYVEASVSVRNYPFLAKLLLDTGNSDALWLFPSKINNFQLPTPYIEDYLGRGFNGDISGKKSRINTFQFSDFRLHKLTTSLPDETSIRYLKMVEDRVGSVGEEILRRFDVIFDYKNESLYLQKNQFFEDPFLFNKSGLEFKHIGVHYEKTVEETAHVDSKIQKNTEIIPRFSQFQYHFQLKPLYAIASSTPNSPAYLSGIRKEDVLVSINGKTASDLSLQEINHLMRLDEGKTMTIVVKRKEQTLRFSFVLKDPIPFED